MAEQKAAHNEEEDWGLDPADEKEEEKEIKPSAASGTTVNKAIGAPAPPAPPPVAAAPASPPPQPPHHQKHQQQPEPAQPTAAAAASLPPAPTTFINLASSLGARLTQAAAAAASDVQQMAASMQAAMAEAAADADEDAIERLTHFQGPRDAAVSSSSASVAPAAVGPPARGVGAADDAPAVDAAKRAEVLLRLESVGGGSGGGGGDAPLESGLKAVDAQVEALAATATRALGWLWGGFSAATARLAGELGGGDGGSSGAAAAALKSAAALAARAEQGLEAAGRTAFQALVGARPQRGGGGDARSGSAAGFARHYALFGGVEAGEEAEALGCECARVCNRARAKLDARQCEALEAELASMAPAFDLSSASPAAAAADDNDDDDDAAADTIAAIYRPAASLVAKARAKADALAAELRQLRVGADDAAAAALGEVGPADDDEDAESKTAQRLHDWCGAARDTAARCLAEVAAAQVQVLLTLGRSAAAAARAGAPLDDGVEWPADGARAGALLRGAAARMLDDVASVRAAFAAAIDVATPSEPLAALRAALTADARDATAAVSDAFRALLYVALLAVLHERGLQPPTPPPAAVAVAADDEAAAGGADAAAA